MKLEELEERYSRLSETFYVDENDLLREKCPHMDELRELIIAYEEILPFILDEEKKYYIYGRLGNMYRMNKQLPEALHYLQESVEYYRKTGNMRAMTVQSVRYAEALKYNHMYTDAVQLFDEALVYCEQYELPDLAHYVWQHKGKCCMEMGNIELAQTCFIKAYVARKEMGDERLLLGSNKALNFISKIKR